MSKEAVLEKIKKLRALSTSSNINEAAAASAIVEKLMQENRIAEAELLIGEEDEAPVLDLILEDGVRVITWRMMLVQTLCKNYSCSVYQTTFKNKNLAWGIAGTQSDIDTVKYLYSWLSMEVLHLATVSSVPLSGKKMFNSFYLGAVVGIRTAMDAANQAVRAEVNNTTAMIKLDARLERAAEVLPSGLRTSKRPGSRYNQSAFAAGEKAGASIHQGQSLGQGGTKLLNG